MSIPLEKIFKIFFSLAHLPFSLLFLLLFPPVCPATRAGTVNLLSWVPLVYVWIPLRCIRDNLIFACPPVRIKSQKPLFFGLFFYFFIFIFYANLDNAPRITRKLLSANSKIGFLRFYHGVGDSARFFSLGYIYEYINISSICVYLLFFLPIFYSNFLCILFVINYDLLYTTILFFYVFALIFMIFLAFYMPIIT